MEEAPRPTTSEPLIIKSTRYNQWALSFIVVFANIGSLLFGYEIGATTWLIYVIDQYGSSGDDDDLVYYRIAYRNSGIFGLIAASAALGAVICYCLLLTFGDNMSKKREMLLAAVFYFAGSLMIAISSGLDWSTATPLVILIIGRFLYGGGIATTLHSIPQYITEVMPVDIRGQYGSSVELMVMSGLNLGFLVGYANELLGHKGYAFPFEVAFIIALLMGFCSIFLPDNPTYLLYNDFSDDDVLTAVQFITPSADMSDIEKLKEAINEEKHQKIVIDERLETYRRENPKHWLYTTGFQDLLTPSLQLCMHDRLYRRCMIVKVMFNFFKILTGQTVILYFASTIFSSLSAKHVQEYVLGYLLMRLAMAYLMMWIGDTFGRRDFLVAGSIITAAAMMIACIAYALNSMAVTIIGIYMSGVGFQLGFGSIAYFILNEITPFYIRASANALANFVLFLSYFCITFLFPYMLEGMGFTYIFLMLSLFNLSGLYYLYFYIPETKGVELEKCYRLVDDMCDTAPQLDCGSACCGTDKGMDFDSQVGRSEARPLL